MNVPVQLTDEEWAWMRALVSAIVNGAGDSVPTYRREKRIGGAILAKLGGVEGEWYPMPEPSEADA